MPFFESYQRNSFTLAQGQTSVTQTLAGPTLGATLVSRHVIGDPGVTRQVSTAGAITFTLETDELTLWYVP